jgi:hypothetical protein
MCAGQAMERNFRAATASQQVTACLNGYAPWIIADTGLRKSDVYRPVALALIRCFQNFLLLRWKDRTRKIGFQPVVAFAHAHFGRQVMQPKADGSFIFTLPLQPAPILSDVGPPVAAGALPLPAVVGASLHIQSYSDPHSVS